MTLFLGGSRRRFKLNPTHDQAEIMTQPKSVFCLLELHPQNGPVTPHWTAKLGVGENVGEVMSEENLFQLLHRVSDSLPKLREAVEHGVD